MGSELIDCPECDEELRVTPETGSSLTYHCIYCRENFVA